MAQSIGPPASMSLYGSGMSIYGSRHPTKQAYIYHEVSCVSDSTAMLPYRMVVVVRLGHRAICMVLVMCVPKLLLFSARDSLETDNHVLSSLTG